MPDARKRPCCICRRWFRPDKRVGSRQRACSKPECQAARRHKTQADWVARNPDYFVAHRIQSRSTLPPPLEPLRLPPPLDRLPWDIAQDQFGGKGADFIGVLATLLHRSAQDQFKAYRIDSRIVPGTLPRLSEKDQIWVQADSVAERAGELGDAT